MSVASVRITSRKKLSMCACLAFIVFWAVLISNYMGSVPGLPFIRDVYYSMDLNSGLSDYQLSSSGLPKDMLAVPVDSRVWKFDPPTSVLSTRPRGTMHPDSLNPKRTYNTEPPNLPQCHGEGDKMVSIYYESHSRLQSFFGYFYTGPAKCEMPDGVQCNFKNDDTLADAVFRFVYFVDTAGPLRYCQDQMLIVFNSEALRDTDGQYQQLDLADIRIDNFLTSDLPRKEACDFRDIYKKNSSADPTERTKGAALFLSDCSFPFRYRYIKELMQYTHVDSYGQCFHNVKEQSSRSGNRYQVMSDTLKSYRMMVTFENLMQEDYITEKIWLAYSSGVIPVYLGPPDIYEWAPGNHTFIDPRDFVGPKALAQYMQRVTEDDDLYRYHTSNFDWDRTRRMMDKYCPADGFLCEMCRLAYKKKSARRMQQ